jgi:flagellar motor switch protein FliG
MAGFLVEFVSHFRGAAVDRQHSFALNFYAGFNSGIYDAETTTPLLKRHAMRDAYRNLKGPEKAAIMILTLGEEHAAKLFEMMGDDEIRDISQAMANLGKIQSESVERLILEFAEHLGSSKNSLVGNYDSTERLLLKSGMPKERVNQILEEIRGPAGRTIWDKLGNVSEKLLANYLKNEYPQTVALVLSKLSSENAARVLSLLPEHFANEVMMRVLRLEAVPKDVLEVVEKTLRTEFMSNVARASRRDTHEQMAEIFNNFDTSTCNRFLQALDDRSRESAERVRQLMFTFDDLVRVEPRDMPILMRAVNRKTLVLALKAAREPTLRHFIQAMSERAARILRDEIDAIGPQRMRDVEEARAEIVNIAKELASKEEIKIASENDSEDIIY